jgi:hypothetical protein
MRDLPSTRQFACAAAIAATGIAFTACDGSTTSTTGTAGAGGSAGSAGSGGTAGAGGGSNAQSYEPQGCGFKVAPRPEYMDWSIGATDVGATPNIRWVRLGLGGNVKVGATGRADPATSMGFAWQTDDGTLASEVAWGSSPEPATWPAENRASGVTWLTPAGSINGTGDARMHEVHICGLTPATTYYYRVGGGPAGKEVWSDVYSFTTTPSDPATPVTIAFAGDSRSQNNDAWRAFQKKVMLSGAALQLFSGDVINFAPDQGEWEKWLDLAWKDEAGNLSTLGQILTVSAHGNHENHTSLFYGNMVLPQDVDNYPQYAELFSSFDVGPVHIVVIDDQYIVTPNLDPAFKDVFAAWLEADLTAANANRAKVPWIIALHHHGEYSSSNHGADEDVLRGREFFVPIWDKHHLDLSVDGHDHNYERSKPLTGPPESPTVVATPAEGTMYIVCAGTGAPAYSAGTNVWTDFSLDYKTSGAIGFYGMLKATQTELKIEGYELRSDGSDPMIDTFTITK